MSATWPLVPLGEILKPVKREEAVGPLSTYRLLGVRLEGKGPFLRETVMGSQTAATKLCRVTAGDFIYSRLFAWRGAFGVVESDLDGCHVSGEFPTFSAAADRVDVQYLRLWFRLPAVLERVTEDCSGSTPLTRNRYKEKFFLALVVPLPPLPEQQRVVARIEELAGKVAVAQRLRERAMQEVVALFSAHLAQVFGKLASAHPTRTFGSFSPHVTSGPRNWAKHYQEDGYRFYRAQDIGQDGTLTSDTKVFLAPPEGSQGRSAMLQQGDLMLVITGATVGRVALYSGPLEPGFVSQHVAICRLPNDQVNPRYAWWAMRAPPGQAQVLGHRYGQGKPGLNLTNIRQLELPVPPPQEQENAVDMLDELETELERLKLGQRQTGGELDALLPAVLDRAFKGEL